MIAVVVRLPVISDDLPARPRTRAECVDVPRPCPFVGCRYNTYLDVSGTGEIRLNSALEPDEVDPALSCALDVADDGGASLRDVGRVLDVTRERARQIEDRALQRMQRLGPDLGDPLGEGGARAPTMSREFRREVRVDEVEADEAPDVLDLERVSFFSADEARVLRHVWRVYARRIGVSTVSVFSREATAARQRRGVSGLVFGAGRRR